MNTAALRQLIAQARQQESGSQALSRFLQTQLERLHPSIRLPGEDTQGVLQRFVSAYIDQVPEVLQAAFAYWQRFSASAMAAVKPRRLKVSLVWVPLPDRAVSTACAPFFMAASNWASDSGVAGQAHSPSVNSS